MKMLLWVLGFLLLYAVHALSYSAGKGVIASPFSQEVLSVISVIALGALFVLTAFFIATRDEVKRAIALQAAGVSMLTTILVYYAIDAFSVSAGGYLSQPWAFSIAVFLIAYGALSWRARF